MDLQQDINYKHAQYDKYNTVGSLKYDYARFGILNRCLPKILFKGNPILVSFLQLLDMRLVMMFKYIDKLKHFKHITWY